MRKELVLDNWLAVETNIGTEYIPADICAPNAEGIRDFVQGNIIDSVVHVRGYGARLSMPGYMDCTEWIVFPTKSQAEAYLEEIGGDNDQH